MCIVKMALKVFKAKFFRDRKRNSKKKSYILNVYGIMMFWLKQHCDIKQIEWNKEVIATLPSLTSMTTNGIKFSKIM